MSSAVEAAKKAGVYHPAESAKLIRRMYARYKNEPDYQWAIYWAKKVHRGVKIMEKECKIK